MWSIGSIRSIQNLFAYFYYKSSTNLLHLPLSDKATESADKESFSFYTKYLTNALWQSNFIKCFVFYHKVLQI